jgi:hypothetical protein
MDNVTQILALLRAKHPWLPPKDIERLYFENLTYPYIAGNRGDQQHHAEG